VLLDDPISALDAQVGRYVFDHAIKEYLADKTVVLVTHQLHLLPEMDHIIVLNDKTVAEQGTYKELMAQSSLLSVLMKDYRLDDDGPVKKQADAKTDMSLGPCIGIISKSVEVFPFWLLLPWLRFLVLEPKL
jgi:ABC-type multidrug transport system ATPase subunit